MTVSDSDWQHQFISTNKIRLHCVTQGEGDLVILLHGFPEFWYSWRYQIPALARHFKVVVPDLRGYNDSDKPEHGYDIDTLASDIIGLIKNLGYRRAHIVGHDWGGVIAWHLAQKFPEYLNRLVVLNAPPPQHFFQELLGNLDQLRRSWYILAFQIPGLPEWLIQQNLSGLLEEWFQKQAIRKGAFSSETLRIYQKALEKAGTLTAALNHYRQFISPQTWWRSWQRLSLPVTVPTLVLWGQEDAILSPALTEGLERVIQAPWRLKLIPECGHWIQQEVPATVNRELLAFLRQVTPAQLAIANEF